jgi:hypothetical protein
MPSTTILRGNVKDYFVIAPSLTPSAVNANSTASQTFTVPGILATDIINTSYNGGAQTAGIVITNDYASAANTITIQFMNVTGTSATPASGNYLIEVLRTDGLSIPVNAG